MRDKKLVLLLTVLLAVAATLTVTVATTGPAEADACYTWNRNLKRGMSGGDVKQLKIRLAGWVGYREILRINKYFTKKTASAVKRFKRAYNIDDTPSGVAGPRVFRKLYDLQEANCSPKHFDYGEFNDSCGENNFTGGKVGARKVRRNIKRLMWKFEALRRKLGGNPIYISSGFRSISCNSAVGGASNSQHLYGTAGDTNGRPGLCRIARRARSSGFSGIIGPGARGHGDHVHLDTRKENNDDGITNRFYWNAPNCW